MGDDLQQSNQLQKDGFVIHPSAIDPKLCTDWVNLIEGSFDKLAREAGCSINEYLRSVSTWDQTNFTVKEIMSKIEAKITSMFREMMDRPVELLECKLLMKGENCHFGTHAHQDISYRSVGERRQYHYSSWIALTKIGTAQGPLEVLPESHREPISEFQDYLKPGFLDRRTSESWKNRRQRILLDAGDMVVFDSRLWHGSSEWTAAPRRYALILRWVIPGIPEATIPQLSNSGRTMYDFSEWLEKSLQLLIGEYSLYGDELLHVCIRDNSIPDKIRTLLKRYMIKRIAKELHGGGAQSGMIYEPLAEAISAEIATRELAD